ncbi:MAG TPA: RluA family pseudouridine synthase [Acidimicrobiales bacterium]|nr:RluA family pseudouridine synthase [Acidimicrobiales bacterium]
MTTESFVVPAALAGERLDRTLALLTGRARADVNRAIAAGGVSVGGEATLQRSRHLKEGELIAVAIEQLGVAERGAVAAAPGEVSFEVVYADDDVIVVNKPVGLVTHPGAGVHSSTLVAGLLERYPELARLPAVGCGSSDRPGIVHRLDKETSGLLVVARSPRAWRALTDQLAARTAKRTYLALVLGTIGSARGVIDAPIGRSRRDPTKMSVAAAGRQARTSYEVLRRFSQPMEATELELRLETGRTHQIRVHLSAIGHPVLGDIRYGGARRSSGVTRLMLHAVALAFAAPGSGELLEFEAPPPEEFLAAVRRFS